MNKFDKKMLKHYRDLCPSSKSGIETIEISTIINGEKKSVTLTKETRKKINEILKQDESA